MTMNRPVLRAASAALAAALAFTLSSGTALAKARITIDKSGDGPTEGFNDPTPVQPVGGNTGTTLGQQRLISFQAAADIWANILDSPVEIIIKATFDPLTCTSTSAVLGSAGATASVANFPNAPLQNVWYPIALANKLAGTDLNGGKPSITAHFNSAIDTGCFLGSKWYYGLDGNHGNDTDLIVTLLHEFGHGLGFAGTTDGETGDFLAGKDSSGNPLPGKPSVFDYHILDLKSGMHWNVMTADERAISGVGEQLVWDGGSVRPAAAKLLVAGGLPILTVGGLGSVAGDYAVGTPSFGPAVSTSGISGRLIAAIDPVEDAAHTALDGCSPLTNALEVHGNIALIDRGLCNFTVKAKNAQNAGAIAVIIADNNADHCDPPNMGGSDSTITIPTLSITTSAGALIRAQLAGGLNVTMHSKSIPFSGADASANPRLYSPCAFEGGSSIYHWDVSATPNLLMEPNINPDLKHEVDLTANELNDIGWGIGWSGRKSLKRGHP
jgi:PA domain